MNCKYCGILLNLDNAYLRKDVPSGMRPECKDCRNYKQRSKISDKICESCGVYCRAKGKRYFCSMFCRLIAYISLNEKTGCWDFRSKWLDVHGYGMFKVNKTTKKAHRISYELFKGKIHNNLYVCHACDNRACVNPDHLWLGTNQDNQLDRFKKKFIV